MTSGLEQLTRGFGREAFGDDPANYHAARPPYPEAVWVALRERAGLRAGIDILEIGAGTGLATEQLLMHEPRRVVAVEPDARLAAYLQASVNDERLEVMATAFEDAVLAEASFDVITSATAFHWLDAVPALERVHGLLRPDGSVALWWNVFGDNIRPDPFHKATVHLFAGHRTSISESTIGGPPYALDVEARLADFAATRFAADAPELLQWQLELDSAGVRALYATYSNVTALPPVERMRLLDGLAEVAAREFGGHAVRNMTTAIYTARREG